MTESLHDRLLEYLGQKGRIGFRRMVEDFFPLPQQQIEAALDQLRRQNLVRAPAPGEWERKAPAGAQDVPPADPPSAPPVAAREIQRERKIAAFLKEQPPLGRRLDAATEETPMAKGKRKKTCVKCKQSKGVTAFFSGDDTCRVCHGGKNAKARKAQKPAARGNGHAAGPFGAAIAALEAEQEKFERRLGQVVESITLLRELNESAA